jgi:hypothetical protein
VNGAPRQRSIRLLHSGMPVRLVQQRLAAPENSDLWNAFGLRTAAYAHSDVSDIWVRYNPFSNFDPANPAAFNDAHESQWYPAIDRLPVLMPLIFDVMRTVEGERLGGVLITRIPPGASVKPHIDQGWHARYYDKFAVQIAGGAKQAFCFEDDVLVSETGDLYTFDNSRKHWVTNESERTRITLIICIRLRRPGSLLWE